MQILTLEIVEIIGPILLIMREAAKDYGTSTQHLRFLHDSHMLRSDYKKSSFDLMASASLLHIPGLGARGDFRG